VPAEINGATALQDCPTRGVCPLFPRNASSHRIVALAGIEFGRAGPALVGDPALEGSVIETTAEGKGAGSAMQIY
jgi:hypothetical protein